MTVAYPIAGIDISKQRLDIAVLNAKGKIVTSSVATDDVTMKKFAQRLRKQRIGLVVLEATGGLEVSVMLALEAEGLKVARCNPQRVRAFANSLGRFAKTDPIDAGLLALYGERARLEPTPLTSENHRELKELVTRRGQLVDERSKEKTRSHQVRCEFVATSIVDNITHLNAQIKTIEKAIADCIANDDDLADKHDLMRSFKGIGPVGAQALLAFLPEIGVVGHRRAAALVGVAPYNDDSGGRRGPRKIKGGRTELRHTLYMAAQTGYRHNTVLRHFYETLRARGRTHKQALIACINKMLKIVSSMLRSKSKFNPQWATD